MALSEQEKMELLSFNTGEPIIVTQRNSTDDCEEYNIVMFVRTIAEPVPQYIRSIQLTLAFPSSYPDESPNVCLYQTRLFHPNFTAGGVWLGNTVRSNETISDYLMRLIRTIQFKEIDIDNIANRNAMAWYNKNKRSEFFPTDKINFKVKPRITIIRINEAIIS